jgi:hypothetical protein
MKPIKILRHKCPSRPNLRLGPHEWDLKLTMRSVQSEIANSPIVYHKLRHPNMVAIVLVWGVVGNVHDRLLPIYIQDGVQEPDVGAHVRVSSLVLTF